VDIGPAQISFCEISSAQVGLMEVVLSEICFTEIGNGRLMCPSPKVSGFGFLLEKFEVMLVCHLDHLLIREVEASFDQKLTLLH
jgi:hypothetical protein